MISIQKPWIKVGLLVLLLFGSVTITWWQVTPQVSAGSDCTVAGALITDTTWSPTSCTTYIATGNVIVNEGVTLTIEPGTIIRFDAGMGMTVRGTLKAVGTAVSPITFTSNNISPTAGDWTGVYFDDTSTDASVDTSSNYLSGSIVQFGLIEYATTGIDLYQATPYIANNTILNNKRGIVYFSWFSVSYPLLVIRANTISNNGNDVNIINGAGLNLTRGRIYILNNLISHNTAASDGGGISVWQTKEIVISNNTIIHNVASTNTNYGDGAGISTNDSGVTLTNNVIAYNQAPGSQSQGGGVNFYQSTPKLVQGNLIMFNESGYGGGMVYSVASMLGMTMDNVIVNNVALNDGGGVMFAFINNSADLTFTHNSIYNNIANGVANDVGTTDNSDREDISAVENWWGTTNLATIESHIFHAVDDANRALVLFQPILTASPSSEQTIATSGGTFNSGDGIVSLTVPANATTESVTVHYGRLFTPTAALPNNTQFVLGFNLFALKADGTAVTQFAHPLTLTINYPSDAELSNLGINENTLTLSYWDGTQWQSAYPCSGCSINRDQNQMTVLLDHFTEFALVAEDYMVFLPTIIRD